MSTVNAHPTSPEPQTDRFECHEARFATHRPQPSTAVVSAHGDLDAANVEEFVDFALRDADHTDRLVLDLSGVKFFGTAGFSALHTVNVRCAGDHIAWALVPSSAVTRLLAICDPDSTLPICGNVETAFSTLHEEPRPLLQLISKSR
ncbi:STAS domain-containing protein [Mycobacterium hubeiense]|uniref:STAS domain-containing protein n=1 Tax=Mycobacterium hubeiense TaxID=1867256 RepID=UPI000C7F4B9E|nr:STAS domain-containing protein [Mycobacterium sp. QGD 101]